MLFSEAVNTIFSESCDLQSLRQRDSQLFPHILKYQELYHHLIKRIHPLRLLPVNSEDVHISEKELVIQ
jgi:hypothetical protein